MTHEEIRLAALQFAHSVSDGRCNLEQIQREPTVVINILKIAKVFEAYILTGKYNVRARGEEVLVLEE